MWILPFTPSGGLAILMSPNSFLYGCQDIVRRIRDTGQAAVVETIVVSKGYILCEALNCKEEKEDERLYFRSAYASYNFYAVFFLSFFNPDTIQSFAIPLETPS
jgi:hypothetical protein